MKKFWLITLTLVMTALLCFGLASCGGKKTVDELKSESGALLEGGSFEEGSTFNVNEIDISEEKATEILNKLEDKGIKLNDKTKAYIYDMFVSKDNAKVQPNGTVKVTISAPKDEAAEGYNVYHIKDNGVIENIPATLKDGNITFETDSFSWYVFTPTYNYVNVKVHFTGDLYVGSNLSDGVTIHSSYKPLTQHSSVVSKGIYLLGEETTLELQLNNQNHTFLGWYEAESFYNGNYDKPVLKDTPVSTETTYTFKSDKAEHVIYAVFAEKGGKLHFNANNGGVITINGEAIEPNYTVDFKVGNSYSLNVIPNEGYRFVGWDIYGKMSYSSVKEASFNFVTKADEREIVAVFEPVVTGLTVDMDTVIYDVSLLEKYTGISIPDFNAICKELGENKSGTTDYVITGKIKSISNTTWGNMILVDDKGNELHVYGLYLEDGTRYGLMQSKPAVGDYITVHGVPHRYNYQPEMKKGYLLNATPTLPNFANATVYANTPESSSILNADEFTVDTSALNAAKPGEYIVTYTYKANPEIKATVTVKVLAAAPVEFSAWANGGTLLLDGVEIGPDYFETFKDGFGKVTLTAVGEENTVFKGWYTGGDNNPTLISTEATYTFEFDKNTSVYAEFDYIATEIYLDGMNMGFDTYGGITEVWLPTDGEPIDVSKILVFAIINGERELLTADDYTIDLGGFNGANPAKGDYTITFTYKANTAIKATHIIRVIDEENMVSFNASSAAGGRVTVDKPYSQFNKGEKVTVTVELRSESDYEFLGWYTVDASGAVGTTCVSTDRTYTVTLDDSVYLYAKVEPKITYLEVEGYEGEPTRIHTSKFWLADREIKVYACGALGKRVELTANDYTVDMGGLDLSKPAIGKYTVTYTYKADTSIKYTVTVLVYNEDHSFLATQNNSNNGWIIFNGEMTQEAGGQYVDGEEITVTAVANEGYTFLGWYLVTDHDTHATYELITTDATYTFTINKDTKIEAKFGAPVTKIDLGNAKPISVYRGERIDLSQIGVWAYSLIETRNLNTDEYTVDLGGLDVNNPAEGTYVITYTYNENPELKATLTVTVMKCSYYVDVDAMGDCFEYNGVKMNNLLEKLEEGTEIVLNAIPNNSNMRVFVAWEAFNINSGEWEIYSTEQSIAIVVDGELRLRPVFDYITKDVKMYENDSFKLYGEGVQDWNFSDQGNFDDALGKYIAYGNIEIFEDSRYANDIESIFDSFRIVTVNVAGQHKVIEASELTIELGDYKAEEGWYQITVSYGTFTRIIDVMVLPADK